MTAPQFPQPDPSPLNRDQTEQLRARQRSRNRALGLLLTALVVLFFAITIVKIGAHSGAAG
ncbi:hypothetical protein [Novosphingobium lentum]|uniref:hypothetical protein n=1 Tax=Novosphingobium lentum TaxID=145287 RepID=UPI00082AA309|nr:hypothetical protein [Novosphingobium lentum]